MTGERFFGFSPSYAVHRPGMLFVVQSGVSDLRMVQKTSPRRARRVVQRVASRMQNTAMHVWAHGRPEAEAACGHAPDGGQRAAKTAIPHTCEARSKSLVRAGPKTQDAREGGRGSATSLFQSLKPFPSSSLATFGSLPWPSAHLGTHSPCLV
jgi:hypothetical protein